MATPTDLRNRDEKGRFADEHAEAADVELVIPSTVEPETDDRGNALGRGGFPRDGRGSALVTSPTGELYKSGPKKGTIKMLPYKSASSVTVDSSGVGLSTWQQKQVLSAVAKDPDFASRLQGAMADAEDADAEDEVMRESTLR